MRKRLKVKIGRAARVALLMSAAFPIPGRQALATEGAELPAETPGARQAIAGSAARNVVTVMVDHAKVVRLPERAQTVVVGNPMIADITVQKNGIVVVTGKGYGVTNLIALNAAGDMLAESLISVQGARESVVTVQRGLDRESYSCTPNCQPALQVGDATKYFTDLQGQTGQRNAMATQR